MEYITAEQFLEQPAEAQKVFLNWWKPSYGNLFFTLDRRYDFKIDRIGAIFDDGTIFDIQKNKGHFKPLLTEGQLREFIEDKMGWKLEFEYNNFYEIKLYKFNDNISESFIYKKYNDYDLGFECNLLQAYWKVALEIAKEGVKIG